MAPVGTIGATGAAPAEVAVEVARRVLDRVVLDQVATRLTTQTGRPEVFRRRPVSLAVGPTGLALLATELDRYAPGQGWNVQCHSHIATAVDAVNANDPAAFDAPLSLFGGLTGLAAVARIAGGGGLDYQRLSGRLDAWLLPRLRVEADRVAAAPGGSLPPAAYDLITGLAGGVAYLSGNEPTTARDAVLRAQARALTRLLGDDDGRPRAAQGPQWMLPEHRDEAPYGQVEMGVAHGLAGLVAALAIIHRECGSSVPGARGALRWGADWLAAHALPGPTWPCAVPLAPDGTPAPSSGRTDHVDPAGGVGPPGGARDAAPVIGPAWCYGTPGIARALWLAGDVLGEREHREYGRAALRAALSQDPAMLSSATLCHGRAGPALVAAHFGWDGDDGWRSAARELIAALAVEHDPTLPLGFQDVENPGARVDNPGLLSGAAGVAITLLVLGQPDRPQWTRLFLLG